MSCHLCLRGKRSTHIVRPTNHNPTTAPSITTGPAAPGGVDEAAAFSLSQSLPQLLSPLSLLSHEAGSALDVSGNGLAALMDAGEVGWRGEGVLPAGVSVVEGERGTEAVRVVVVGGDGEMEQEQEQQQQMGGE